MSQSNNDFLFPNFEKYWIQSLNQLNGLDPLFGFQAQQCSNQLFSEENVKEGPLPLGFQNDRLKKYLKS